MLLAELLTMLAFQIWACLHVERKALDYENERDAEAFVALIDRWRREDLVTRFVLHGNPRAAALMLKLPAPTIRRMHRRMLREDHHAEQLRNVIRDRASKVIR